MREACCSSCDLIDNAVSPWDGYGNNMTGLRADEAVLRIGNRTGAGVVLYQSEGKRLMNLWKAYWSAETSRSLEKSVDRQGESIGI